MASKSGNEKDSDLEFVTQSIRKHMPRLVGFMDNEEPVKKYSDTLYRQSVSPKHLERQKTCIRIIREKLGSVFTKEEVSQMNLPLENGITASIVDHHNILNHPLLVSGIIISSLGRIMRGSGEEILVLSTTSVPLNNNFHKRGFTFRKRVLPFVSSKQGDKMVKFLPKKKIRFFETAQQKGLFAGLSENEIGFLKKYEHTLNDIDWDKAMDFADQILLLNNRLFPLMFSEDIRKNVPALVYFDSEYLAAETLKILISQRNNFVYRAMFDEEFRRVVLEEFDGIYGAWNATGKKIGTHFFWARRENGEEAPLWLENGWLVSPKADVKPIKFEPDNIVKQLESENIYPALLINYAAIVFYCGVKPLTGIGSLNYLSDMKEKWVNILKRREPEEAKLVESTDPSGLINGPIVTFGRDTDGRIVEKYFADIVFEGGLKREYLQKISEIPLKELMKSSLLSIYEVKVPAADKKPLKLDTSDLVGKTFDWIK